MTDQRGQYQRLLLLRVGGFFHNTVHDPERTCTVCRAPKQAGDLCVNCAEHRAEFGTRLADDVLILTYVRGRQPRGPHQSAHTVRAYKNIPPVEKCATDMALMVRAATDLHSDCIETHCDGAWSSVTFVPSRHRPAGSHPVAELARQVRRNNGATNRFLLGIGCGFDGSPERTVRADRFSVPPEYADRVAGRHVLLIDDTWVTGTKLQSAAVTLHQAGATRVTALCVARWCRDDWQAHRELLDSCTLPYDALTCPVSGSACVSP
jgi:hypothetical protein